MANFRTTIFLLASGLAVAQFTTNPLANLPRLGQSQSPFAAQQGQSAATPFQSPFAQQAQGQTAATQFQNPFAQQAQQGQTAATQFQNPFAQQAQQGQGLEMVQQGYPQQQMVQQPLNYQSQSATTTCCTAYSAECMGCMNGMTAQQFCASSPTSTVCASQGAIGGTSQQRIGPINLPFTSGATQQAQRQQTQFQAPVQQTHQFQAPVQQTQFQAPVQQTQTTQKWSNPFFQQQQSMLSQPMIQGYPQQQMAQQGYPQQQLVQQASSQQGYSFGASTGTGISNIDIKQKIIRPTSSELPSKAGIKFANTDGTLQP